MNEKIYRGSSVKLTVDVIVDILLMFVFVGWILLPIHILEYLKKSLSLGANGIALRVGALSTTTTEIPYSKINSVTVKRGVFGKIFGYGDIAILTGNDLQGIPFKGIDNPEKLKSEIMSKV
jgi:uncharacterized membrane protein YdbT with pleckstrin-like domain